jgi:hypothetical protein
MPSRCDGTGKRRGARSTTGGRAIRSLTDQAPPRRPSGSSLSAAWRWRPIDRGVGAACSACAVKEEGSQVRSSRTRRASPALRCGRQPALHGGHPHVPASPPESVRCLPPSPERLRVAAGLVAVVDEYPQRVAALNRSDDPVAGPALEAFVEAADAAERRVTWRSPVPRQTVAVEGDHGLEGSGVPPLWGPTGSDRVPRPDRVLLRRAAQRLVTRLYCTAGPWRSFLKPHSFITWGTAAGGRRQLRLKRGAPPPA